MENITDKDLLRAIELMNERKLNKALAEERLSMIEKFGDIVEKECKRWNNNGEYWQSVDECCTTIFKELDKLTNTNK